MGAAGHLLFHPAFLKGAYTMGKITQDHFDLYINGKWVPAKDGATFQTRCPALSLIHISEPTRPY